MPLRLPNSERHLKIFTSLHLYKSFCAGSGAGRRRRGVCGGGRGRPGKAGRKEGPVEGPKVGRKARPIEDKMFEDRQYQLKVLR